MADNATLNSKAKQLIAHEGGLSKYSSLFRPLNQIEIAEAVAVGTLAANTASKEVNR